MNSNSFSNADKHSADANGRSIGNGSPTEIFHISLSGYTSGAHQTHTHSYSFDTSYNGSSTDTESRPDNLTIKIWKRVS